MVNVGGGDDCYTVVLRLGGFTGVQGVPSLGFRRGMSCILVQLESGGFEEETMNFLFKRKDEAPFLFGSACPADVSGEATLNLRPETPKSPKSP